MTVQIGGELMEVECQGLYDRKYAALHCEGNPGDDGRNSQCWYEEDNGEKFQTICSCCTDYSTWKQNHKEHAQALQQTNHATTKFVMRMYECVRMVLSTMGQLEH